MLAKGSKRQHSPVLEQRLEEYDFLRVAQELDVYTRSYANEISLSLPAPTFLFGSFVTLTVTFNKHHLERILQGEYVELFEMWIDWPPARPTEHFGQRGLSITKIVATIDSTPIEAQVSQRDNKTLVGIYQRRRGLTGGNLTVTLSAPSCYFLLPGRFPFQRNLLNINLKLLCGSPLNVMYLDHPANISLRARVDNAIYHSLAYAFEDAAIRKISFFKEDTVHIRYFWGINDTPKLMAPVVPLYTSGISLIAASFTLALVQASLSDLASAVLAFALLPPILQLFSQQRLMFPSADINRFSVADLMALVSLIIYLPLIVSTGLALTFFPSIQNAFQSIDFGVGLSLLVGAALYVVLLEGGVFQYYACDKCERRISWRRNAHLHVPTRRTLCKNCWESQLALDVANTHYST